MKEIQENGNFRRIWRRVGNRAVENVCIAGEVANGIKFFGQEIGALVAGQTEGIILHLRHNKPSKIKPA